MKYRRFKAEKLVRDKTVERLTQKGWITYCSQASDKEYPIRLLDKLKEEAEEVTQAKNKEECISELADLMEVIRSFCAISNITLDDVEKVRKQQHEMRGGFDQRVVCHYIEIAQDNPAIEYCLARPEKYPEISIED